MLLSSMMTAAVGLIVAVDMIVCFLSLDIHDRFNDRMMYVTCSLF